METINVEEFKRNIKACLDQLPFAVTRRGKVLFVCYGPEGKPVDIPEKPPCQSMPEHAKSLESPLDTVYVPNPVRPVKQPKPKTNAAPIVNAMLSGVKARPTVAHHPTCTCAMCKPA